MVQYLFGLDDICVRWRKTWWEHGGDMVDMVFNRKCQKSEVWNKNNKYEQINFGMEIVKNDLPYL